MSARTKLPGLSPQSPLATAGPLLVSARLADVRRHESALSPAAPEPEVVHDMRVAARRLRAALTLLGDGDLASLEPEVKALQDALGAVRDTQVQTQWLEKADHGAEALAATVERGSRAKSMRLEDALKAWSSVIAPALTQLVPAHAARPGRLGGRLIGKPIRERLARVDRRIGRVLSDASPRPVHRLRIEAKKLRYAAELVAAGHPKATKVLLRWLEPVLDRLGDIHDLDVRTSMLKDADGEAPDLLREVEHSRAEHVHQLLAHLRTWKEEALRERFDRAFRRRKDAKRLARAMKRARQQDRAREARRAGDQHREIEQKFLVRPDVVAGQSGIEYRQGYLAATPRCSIRVRIAEGEAHLTVKGTNEGVSRAEWEYPIPAADAEALLGLSPWPIIEKTRYELNVGSRTWEIDQFHGMNEGLVVAEVELEREDERVEWPPWVVKDVSRDPRFYNVNLAQHPYQSWPHES